MGDWDFVVFLGVGVRPLDLTSDHLAEVLQVYATGHELRERVGEGEDGFAEIAVAHSRGTSEPAGARHGTVVGGGARAICGHGPGLLMGGLGRVSAKLSLWFSENGRANKSVGKNGPRWAMDRPKARYLSFACLALRVFAVGFDFEPVEVRGTLAVWRATRAARLAHSTSSSGSSNSLSGTCQ